MESTFDSAKKLMPILMPYATGRRQSVIRRSGRFVHYTSVENAMKIIKSQEFWLRDVRLMNDYSETTHGHERLKQYFSSDEKRGAFVSALNNCGDRIAEQVVLAFDQWWAQIPGSTFLCCLSEHHDQEDEYGRLSMWQGYGSGAAGAALVLKLPLDMIATVPWVMFSPVAYPRNGSAFDLLMKQFINSVRANCDFLTSIPSQLLVRGTTIALILAALSLKHPGFREEREWRAIYLPYLPGFQSPLLTETTATIGGYPQPIYKLGLKDTPEAAIVGMEASKVIDRVILAPSTPHPSAEVFIGALMRLGIEDARRRVVISTIPRRQRI